MESFFEVVLGVGILGVPDLLALGRKQRNGVLLQGCMGYEIQIGICK